MKIRKKIDLSDGRSPLLTLTLFTIHQQNKTASDSLSVSLSLSTAGVPEPHYMVRSFKLKCASSGWMTVRVRFVPYF